MATTDTNENKINWDAKQANMVITSEYLLQKYWTLDENGKSHSSPWEALVFGKIFKLSQGQYGYCSLSKEHIAYELGTSYDTILRAFKNLLKDKFIKEVKHSPFDNNSETKCFVVDLDRLYAKHEIWMQSGIGFNNDKRRKERPERKKKEAVDEISSAYESLSQGATTIVAGSESYCR